MLNLPPLLVDFGVFVTMIVVHKTAGPVIDAYGSRLGSNIVLTGLKQPGVRFAEVIVIQTV